MPRQKKITRIFCGLTRREIRIVVKALDELCLRGRKDRVRKAFLLAAGFRNALDQT